MAAIQPYHEVTLTETLSSEVTLTEKKEGKIYI